MTGKELILATKPYAQEIRSRSWFHTLTAFTLLVGALTGTLVFEAFLLKLLCSILAGLFIVRVFVIYHDHQHHSILNKSVPANILMTLFGIYVLAPTSIWKRSHDYHHNHNSKLFSASIGSYPIATKSKFLAMSASERRIYLAIRHPLTIIFGYITMFILGMCVSSFISTPKKHFDSLIALIIHAAVSVFIVTMLGWQAWLLTIFIPFFIACGIGSYLFYAQHNFPGVTFSDNKEWKYEVAALDSSSHMLMNPVMQWVTANIGYHHIHHLNSRIPFYRLPEAMDNIPALQNARTTSLSLKDIIACFRLKIWDPELKRMTGIKNL
jgi:acyl-lipid omega-6 desaturase (Delta-12 desaturase)